jgi:hypothetical protein
VSQRKCLRVASHHHAKIAADPYGVRVTIATTAIADDLAANCAKEPIHIRVLGAAAPRVMASLASLQKEGVPLYVGSIEDPRSRHEAPRSPLAVIVHRYDGVAIIELEPARGTIDVFSSMYPVVRTFTNSLQERRQRSKSVGACRAGDTAHYRLRSHDGVQLRCRWSRAGAGRIARSRLSVVSGPALSSVRHS